MRCRVFSRIGASPCPRFLEKICAGIKQFPQVCLQGVAHTVAAQTEEENMVPVLGEFLEHGDLDMWRNSGRPFFT